MNLSTHSTPSSSVLYMLSHYLLSMRENITTKEMMLSLQEEEKNKLRQMVGLLTQVRKLECERHTAEQ